MLLYWDCAAVATMLTRIPAQKATTVTIASILKAVAMASRPLIPRRVDAELLSYADGRDIDTWHDERAKHEVRDGFWAALTDKSARG